MEGFGIQESTLTVAVLCKKTVDHFVKEGGLSTIEEFNILAKTVACYDGKDKNLDWHLGAIDSEVSQYLSSFLEEGSFETVIVGGIE